MGSIFGKIHNKNCCCGVDNCCFPRCLPLVADTINGVNIPGDCANPLPECLTVDLTATPNIGATTCFNGTGEICYRTPLSYDPGVNCWEGVITGTCTDCNGNTFNWSVTVVLCCTSSGQWSVSAEPGSPCVSSLAGVFDAFSCDPMRVTGCFVGTIVGCFVGCLNGMNPTDPPEYELCFDIYEVP